MQVPSRRAAAALLLATLSCATDPANGVAEATYRRDVSGISVELIERKFFVSRRSDIRVCAPSIVCVLANAGGAARKVVLQLTWHYPGEQSLTDPEHGEVSVGPGQRIVVDTLTGVPVEGPREGISVDVRVAIDGGEMTPVFEGVPIEPAE